MRCRNVRHRLVAYQDGELSPGEAHQVGEHLARCADCRQRERRLAAVTPQARLLVPPDVRARLHSRVDGPVVRAIAASRPDPRRSAVTRWLAWLQRDTEIPVAGLLAYAVVFAVVLGWGLSNWLSLGRLEARLASQDDLLAPPPRPPVHEPIPAEQYRPASWTPEEEGGIR